MSLSKLFGAPDRKEVSALSVDQKLDAAQTAASGTVAAKAKGLMGMVKSISRKAMGLLADDARETAGHFAAAGSFLANDARRTAGHAAAVKDAVVGSAKSAAGAVRDVNAGLGALARGGVLATGMVGAMAAPAFSEEAPSATDGMVSGAKTELAAPSAAPSPADHALVTDVSSMETVLLAKNDTAPKGGERIAESLSDPAKDPAFQLSYAMAKKGGEGQTGKVPDKENAMNADAIDQLVKKKGAEFPGLEGIASYAQYVIEMENLRKTNPAAYERFSKERGIVALNIWEARYTQEYPVCVVDPYHVGAQYDVPASKIRTDYDAASLKGSLSQMFLEKYDEAYALDQFKLDNPAFAGKGGGYDPSVIKAKAESQGRLVARWAKRMDQGATVALPSGKTVAQLAAENLNAFHAFQKRYSNVRVNAFAKEKEDLAVLSWTYVANGVKMEGGKFVSNSPWISAKTYNDGNSAGVNPYLLQGDLSQIAIAYQARLKPEELRQTYELEVVRVKDLDGLVAKVRAVIGEAQFNECYQYVPAGFEKDSSEHKLSVLRLVMNAPKDFMDGFSEAKRDEIAAVAKHVRQELATTSRTPLIGLKDKLEALDAIGLVAKPGTPERQAQVALLENLQERCLNQALAELRPKDDVESAVLAVEHEQAKAAADKSEAEAAQAKAEAAQAKSEADKSKAELDATKAAVALFHKWETATPEEKRKIASELKPIVENLLASEKARENPDKKTLAVLKHYLSVLG